MSAVFALVVAAGRGTRFGGTVPKQYLPLGTATVLRHAAASFTQHPRIAGVQVIRYRSVRDPKQGMNLALLSCRVFTRPEPVRLQTWRMHLRARGGVAICEAPKSTLEFDRAAAFAADPRIAALRWTR